MQQRGTTTMAMEERLLLYPYPSFPKPSEHEIEVAQILLQLPDMIHHRFESPLPLLPISLPSSWGCQRKRSALSVKNDYAWTLPRQPSCYSSQLLQPSLAKAALPLPPPSANANALKVETTSSPDTPLCFEPSEDSDDMQPQPHHQLRKIVPGKRDLHKLEHHYAKLNDFNLELKERKQKLRRLSHKPEEEARLEIDPSLNSIQVMPLCQPAQVPTVVTPPPAAAAVNQEPYQHHQPIPLSCVMPYQHQLQLFINQTAQTQRRPIYENFGYIGGLRMVKCNNNAAAPRMVSQPYALSSLIDPVEAAKQARQKRLKICREKKPRRHFR